MPISPSSPSFATISYGKRFSRSSSSATGAISPSANSRTVRRIRSWSGERSKSIRPSKQRTPRELEQQPGCDRQRLAGLADVLDVAVATLDQLVVERVERQSPDALAGRLAGRRHGRAPVVVVAHQPRVHGA